MRLLVVRHGQSEADILKVCEGRADFSLTKLGHEQVEKNCRVYFRKLQSR
ncbi:phosphoglycerate mutase family protein [Lactobacillus acidophilus]|nr:phosphoglycerate mutase family protein [Lactobacillus acidophilus]